MATRAEPHDCDTRGHRARSHCLTVQPLGLVVDSRSAGPLLCWLLGRPVLLSSPRRHHVLRTFSIGRSRRGPPLGTGLPAGTYLQRRLSWPALVEWRLHISSRTIAWRSTAARPSRRAHGCHAAIRRQG